MPSQPGDEEEGGWMIGYLDVMTLLVALLVLIFTLSFAERRDEADSPSASVVEEPGPLSVPLPERLERVLAARPTQDPPPEGWLANGAVSAALGVAGLPPRPPSTQPPPMLARQALPRVAYSPTEPPPPSNWLATVSPQSLLPQPLVPEATALDLPSADFLLVLTDRPPEGMREVSPEAIAGAETLAERLANAPYMPDLEGVAVSRVSEGIRLRVEDQWLFPTAEAELTDDGEALVQRMVEIVQRHDGEVAVEGHTDSRTIDTEEFPSNWVLSSARAIAIVHALEEAGVDARRLRAVGLADTRPLADNDTAEGRARNRRVEVIIHAR
ncbi:OmpA family protein [Billgrantia gudaonensis]|uniref:Chemotaxis protein MotB n=1 Tax=Billgrantia gudaonensis TaxID=376427 RepID=A0A1G8T2X0_9GAMM|nr:OmpA family protein [Halomonas gudaonensis]SDJ34990.1 chemotaxis protein MotB [Halomonas gudaonensis]